MGILYGLTNSAETNYFTLDVIAPQLDLISPNGGEAWYIGDTNDILWTATDTNLAPESVYLWYSLNGGTSYVNMAEAITNTGTYPWEMPSLQAYNARVRIQVSDIFGNSKTTSSLGTFSITYAPPAAPEDVIVNTSNNIDAVLSWQPVTSTIFGTPIVPDGYFVLYNETPYEDDQFYYYHGETPGTTYTHHNVVLRRDQMFYKIVAFKDYDGRLGSVLSSMKKDSGQPRLWKEILEDFHNEGVAK